MTCPTLRLYNLVSKIPVREHIGFFRTKFRWIQFGKADSFLRPFHFHLKKFGQEVNFEYHVNKWFGSSNFFIIDIVGQLLDQWRTAWGLTLQLVCNKGVFSAHICFVQSWNDHSPSGGHKAMVLATISKTEGFRYWICVLLMMSLYVQKSYEEIGHVLDMLVDAFRKVGFVLNAGKNKKKRRRANIQQNFQ